MYQERSHLSSKQWVDGNGGEICCMACSGGLYWLYLVSRLFSASVMLATLRIIQQRIFLGGAISSLVTDNMKQMLNHLDTLCQTVAFAFEF